jgi:hypothetical protein
VDPFIVHSSLPIHFYSDHCPFISIQGQGCTALPLVVTITLRFWRLLLHLPHHPLALNLIFCEHLPFINLLILLHYYENEILLYYVSIIYDKN